MIEVLVIIALCALLAWDRHENRKERSKLINAIMAKTPQDLRDLEFVDKVKVDVKPPVDPDLIPVDQMSDEQFGEMVGQSHG